MTCVWMGVYFLSWLSVPIFFSVRQYEIAGIIAAVLTVILVAILKSGAPDKAGRRQFQSSCNGQEGDQREGERFAPLPQYQAHRSAFKSYSPSQPYQAPPLPSAEQDQARFRQNQGWKDQLARHQADPANNYMDPYLAHDLEHHPELFPTGYHSDVSMGRTPNPRPGPSDPETDKLLDNWIQGRHK